jgi:hypothetical protein
VAAVQAERAAFETGAVELSARAGALTAWLRDTEWKAERQRDAPMDADAAVVPSDPASASALAAHADDAALSDALGALDEALQRGRMGLDAYLKHVRDLSRRQFYARAAYLRTCVAGGGGGGGTPSGGAAALAAQLASLGLGGGGTGGGQATWS